MKLVKEVNLFFKEGNSDKVYIIEMFEVSSDKYLVNFKYGRRGQSYKEGTKTPEFVNLSSAEALFSSLEKEKRGKGYQSELEIDVVVPSTFEVNLNTKEGTILQRLSDAINKKESFQTEWKTSRVIWKAVEYNISEAIPYMFKLISKGDEQQTYACLYGLAKMKVKNAEPVFTSFRDQSKQKFHIKNVATMGLLMTLENQELKNFQTKITHELSEDIQEILQRNQYELLSNIILDKNAEEVTKAIHNLYFLSYLNLPLKIAINNIISKWPMEPPYFKVFRSIYKLSILTDDYTTMANCVYAVEKKNSMFRRTVALSNKNNKQEFSFLDDRVNPKKELSSEDSRLAFSQQTKLYLQKSSLRYLDSLGAKSEAKDYLQAAIAILCQYENSDYNPKSRNLVSNYGRYDYNDGKYYFTKLHLPECYSKLLLSNIVLDVSNNQLDGNLHYYEKREIFSSKNYFFNESEVKKIKESSGINKSNNTYSQEEDSSILKSTILKIKSWFGSKSKEDEEVFSVTNENVSNQNENIESEHIIAPNSNLKYYHHWQNNPQAFIKLLFDAKMDRVMQFAYEELKKHPSKEQLQSKLTKDDLLNLFNKSQWPNLFAFDVLKSRQAEFEKDKDFISKVLDCKYNLVVNWATKLIDLDQAHFFEDINFVSDLLFNTNHECKDNIDNWIKNNASIENRAEAIVAKSIIRLLSINQNALNDEKVSAVQSRLFKYFEKPLLSLTEKVLVELQESPIIQNSVLSSDIAVLQSNKVTKIPSIGLIINYLNSASTKVNMNGLFLMSKLDKNTKESNLNQILTFINHSNPDVVKECFLFFETIENESLRQEILAELLNSLIRKEKYEGAHLKHSDFINSKYTDLFGSVNKGQLMNLVHCNYRIGQEMGYEILKKLPNPQELSIGQIVSFGNHELLSLRNWCYNYFNSNVDRVRKEKDKSLKILNSSWIETRDFAYAYFRNNFRTEEWVLETLIQLIDNTDPQTVQFGKEMLTKNFDVSYSGELIDKLTQHPNISIQSYAADLINSYGEQNSNELEIYSLYFKTVLTNVHKGRAIKSKVYSFFENELQRSEKNAIFIAKILNEVSATSLIGDKERCISILADIKSKYPNIEMNLELQNIEL